MPPLKPARTTLAVATRSIAMVYGLLELGAALVIVGILTAPFWAQGVFAWMTRPFGAPTDSDRINNEDDL